MNDIEILRMVVPFWNHSPNTAGIRYWITAKSEYPTHSLGAFSNGEGITGQ